MKYFFIILSITLFFTSCSKRPGKPRILIFSKTAGYHHESIPDGITAIQKLGKENNIDVDTTSNSEFFNEDTLRKYSAIVFLHTTGNVLNHYQEADFERYIQAGGGYVGIHAAVDCEYDWQWYGRLAGGYFLDHPGINDTFPNVQGGTLNILSKDHLSTKSLPASWHRRDEWYSFKRLDSTINVVLKIDEKTYQGGKRMDDHPMAWYHEYDGGRAFYTALGHTRESYSDTLFLKHILGGVQYAIGDNKELNYNNATSLRTPEEDRFKKTMLVTGQFFEPIEMTILPNLDVLIAQRKGEIMLYKNGDSTIKQVGYLKAYFKSKRPDINAEEGVLGIKADPKFSENHYVYIFYSPADTSVNRLSRFKFENDVLDAASEKVILQFYSQREICCHTGGSIAFDKDGLLYVSTGDNSNPFNEPNQRYVSHGYAPLDQRPGHEQYDARRTSGNANDLRGKILRIRINEDGTYDTPDDNLYPKGTPGTRSEIYVQGNRNPYRIAVDQKNSFLYWGEVGPDASTDSLDTHGPRGYDEVNQARKAGYFGWPLFVGNNYAYHSYDYATGKAGEVFDAKKPINNSLNNTGIKDLPPAQPAFIWYPYAPSPDFPQVKSGGRNAMAGPVYYTDMFPAATRLPEYYNKKLFIYDWVRGWISAVTLQPNGDFDKMEPFLEHTKLNALIDMEVGPDGKLYFLEYGNGWFSKNADAGLSRIEFNSGNLAPKISAFNVDKLSGSLPLTIKANVTATDHESKQLTYRWSLGNVQKETTTPNIDFTFTKPGEYTIAVTVTDEDKEATSSSAITVYAGNEAPEVSITTSGNKSFYFPGTKVSYSVNVVDDESSSDKDLSGLIVSADYFESRDKASSTTGHHAMTEIAIGKNLIQALDCKTCHKQEEKSIGPAYHDVAMRYQNSAEGFTHLVNKIRKGGSGVWGETNMPAHPDMKENEARQIVSWVLSLAGPQLKQSLPQSGSIDPSMGKSITETGELVLSASYTDKGGQAGKPLTAHAELVLHNNNLNFNEVKEIKEFKSYRDNGIRIMVTPQSVGSFRLGHFDLKDISTVDLAAFWKTKSACELTIEIHSDTPDGKIIGKQMVQVPANTTASKTVQIKVDKGDDKIHALYLVSKASGKSDSENINLKSITFRNN
ncbi:MAG TPA: ThuA domain-containing protein [Cyclobacteriaceae bacterium]|nr:ThuA domain-containing protein [Cyclobacteriaceae bacterium]